MKQEKKQIYVSVDQNLIQLSNKYYKNELRLQKIYDENILLIDFRIDNKKLHIINEITTQLLTEILKLEFLLNFERNPRKSSTKSFLEVLVSVEFQEKQFGTHISKNHVTPIRENEFEASICSVCLIILKEVTDTIANQVPYFSESKSLKFSKHINKIAVQLVYYY